MMNLTQQEKMAIPTAPEIPGLVFRHFNDESDYPILVALLSGCNAADGLERADTLEGVAHNYSHLEHCDLSQDFVLAEVAGTPVAYQRVWWEQEKDGPWLGMMVAKVLPEWRRKGLGSALLRWGEDRLSLVAARLRSEGSLLLETPCRYSLEVYHTEKARIALLEKNGYAVARSEHVMVRPDLEAIPDAPMPPGLEARPAVPEHYRRVWEAAVEAFQDHWGFIPPTENGFENFISEPFNDPSLWQVGWDGDQVAGSVLAFINNDENQALNRLRGYSEGISVRRPWRRRGLARALLVRSLQEFKRRGMQEAALSVDTQNWHSAYKLYESVGFRIVTGYSYFQKSLQPGV